MKRLRLCFVLIALLTCALHAAPLQQKDTTQPSNHKQQASSPQNNPQSAMASKETKESHIQGQQCPPGQKCSVPKQDDPDYTFWAFVINIALTVITLAIAITGIVQSRAA